MREWEVDKDYAHNKMGPISVTLRCIVGDLYLNVGYGNDRAKVFHLPAEVLRSITKGVPWLSATRDLIDVINSMEEPSPDSWRCLKQ